MSGAVTLTITNAVAHIVLDRPEKLNAMTPAMSAALADHCRAVDADPAVRVVLLSGAGSRAFSAGSDLNALGDKPGPWAFRNRIEYARVVRDIRKPVIAALHGWVLGGGLEMAIAADIRIAAASAKLGTPEVTRGWLGGGGASQMLPRLVGYGGAMKMLLSGEPIEANEALRIGLVEEVVPDADLAAHALAFATKIAGYSPIATQAIKAATRMALAVPLEAGLAYENELHTICMQSHDQAEGIAAFAEKRPPRFSGS
jgi:enoyl-CoA hydratase